METVQKIVDTPIGKMTLVAEGDEVVCIEFGEQWVTKNREHSDVLDQLEQQLNEYFEGRRKHFDLKLHFEEVPVFYRDVLEEVDHVEYGEVSTYGEIAERVNNPRAVRATGTAIAKNPFPIVIPCHRILGSGKNAYKENHLKYVGGADKKRFLLELEGITIL